jgi:hypothetical protein
MSATLRFSMFSAATALLAALCLFSVERAKADPFTISFPSGLVCKNSAVNVTVAGNGGGQVTKTFTTRDGTIRALSAGTGSDLVFYNPNHPEVTFSLKGNGAVNWSTTSAGGTTTVTLTGHNIVFYFPTDTLIGGTPGPATLLVTGREVFTVDAAGNFTQVSETGNVTDICSQLPPD